MSNRVVKVSILLIFMLFVTGLFNFCFAAITEADYELLSEFTESETTIRLTHLTKAFNDFTPETCNSTSHLESFLDRYVASGDFANVNILYAFNKTNGTLYCVLVSNKHYLGVEGKSSGIQPFDVINGTREFLDEYLYDWDTGTWNAVSSGFTQRFSNATYIVTNRSTASIYYNKDSFFGYTLDNCVFNPSDYKPSPSVDIFVNQTGSKTGHVEFTPVNWNGSMYYIKDNMDELVRLIAEEELSKNHNKVKYYNGSISIESGEYVMALLFDDSGNLIFLEISDTITLDSDIMFDDTHRLRLDQADLDTYYLFVHSPQDGDYLKVSSVPITASDFNTESKIIDGSLSYNGLSIRSSFINGFNQLTREINITKNTVNYFYLYDINNNLVDSAVLNTSNYYDGSDFDFDVELQYGSSSSKINPVLAADNIGWCKVIPNYSVSNVNDLELYFRISGYHDFYDRDDPIYISKDGELNDTLPYDTINMSTDWIRIDNRINRYFYICTMNSDNFVFFELELRTKDGQVIQNKGFKIYITPKSKNSYTGDMTVDGESVLDDLLNKDLSSITGNNGNFDFSGLNNLSEEELKTNLTSLINNSIGFFGLVSTLLLLLPNWISSLLYLFFFGIIVITLLRFIRGS